MKGLQDTALRKYDLKTVISLCLNSFFYFISSITVEVFQVGIVVKQKL